MSRVSAQIASVATVSDQWPDLVSRAKVLCRTVAGRDLDGLPLYILLQSEVADVMGLDNFSDGYTSPNLDLNLDPPLPVDFQAVPDPGRIKFETMVIANALKHEYRPLPTAWYGHEDQFIRITLHLHYRANAIGVKTIPNLLCAGRRYGLSHAHR